MSKQEIVALFDNIEACNYQCEAGPLKNNLDYLAIKRISLSENKQISASELKDQLIYEFSKARADAALKVTE